MAAEYRVMLSEGGARVPLDGVLLQSQEHVGQAPLVHPHFIRSEHLHLAVNVRIRCDTQKVAQEGADDRG